MHIAAVMRGSRRLAANWHGDQESMGRGLGVCARLLYHRLDGSRPVGWNDLIAE